MIKNWARYLLALLAALAFFLCFNGYLSHYVLAITLALPFLSLLLSLPGILCTHLKLTLGTSTARKGQEVMLRLKISSKSFVASPRARVTFAVENTLTGESQQEVFFFTACRGGQVVEHRLSSSSCGQVVCRLSHGRTWDYLGMFPLPLRLPEEQSVLFYPVPCGAALELQSVSMPEDEGESYSQSKPGEDPSELFSLRDYRDGDKLSRVHWKLSQKTGQTLVKEFGLPVADHLLFLVELEGSGQEADALLDALATLSGFLNRQETAHRVGFWDKKEQRLCLMEITGEDEETSMLTTLLTRAVKSPLPLPEEGELPPGLSHILYLSCRPQKELAASLRLWAPGARLTVIHAAADPQPPELPEQTEYVKLSPGRVGQDLNGLRL